MEVSIDFSQLGMVQLGIVCAYIVTLIAGIKEIKGLSTRVIYCISLLVTSLYKLQMQMQLAGKIDTVDLICTVIFLICAIGSIALHEIEKSR